MRTIEAPQSSQLVRVRQRQYFVEEVTPPRAGDDSTLVRMSCLDDDAQGQSGYHEASVLHREHGSLVQKLSLGMSCEL